MSTSLYKSKVFDHPTTINGGEGANMFFDFVFPFNTGMFFFFV